MSVIKMQILICGKNDPLFLLSLLIHCHSLFLVIMYQSTGWPLFIVSKVHKFTFQFRIVIIGIDAFIASTRLWLHYSLYTRLPSYRNSNKLISHTLRQCFPTFVRPRPGEFFFIRRGPGCNKFTLKYLSILFKLLH